ncbi:hypothetical protein BR93DRAFT_965368 [Coniochaeta sp. PMI_546]|nr:hypothetical protein BR93DRAFT_965368 [Coniochaeta sp. PMI_546]
MPTDSTPLLAGVQELPPPTSYLVREHSIFLRVCHSPWTWIPQATLTKARGLVAVYLTALWPILINLKLRHDEAHGPWLLAFDFSMLSYLLLWLYHVIVFCWTNTHCRWAEIDEGVDSWQARLLRAMSPPVQRPDDCKRFWFSVFYTTTQVFALINVLVYWAVLVPHGQGDFFRLPDGSQRARLTDNVGVSKIFDKAWFESFWICNLWGFTALIVFIEAMFLNNVKRQAPVIGHILGLMSLLAAYLGWAAVGKLVTGYSPYFFLDADVVGSRLRIALNSAGFVALGPLVFALLYGLIGLREKTTRRRVGST